MRAGHAEIIAPLLVGLSALVGLALTCLGLGAMPWPDAIPWVSAGGHLRFAGFLGAVGLTVFVACRTRPVSPFAAGAAVLAMMALAAGALWPAVVVVWLTAAFAVAGRVVLASAGVDDSDWLVCFVIGAGVYGTMVGLLAHVPINHPSLYAVALALPLILARRSFALLVSDVAGAARGAPPAARGPRWLGVAVAALGLVLCAVAMMPEVGHDALAQHLFVPVHLRYRHQWSFDASTYTWAVMPMLGDWLFSIAYMLAGETAARLVNVESALALAWLVHRLASWAGATPAGALWAVLIFLSSPLTFTEAASLFVESPWALFVATGVLALLRSATEPAARRSGPLIAGLAFGLALGAKAVTFALLPVLLVVLLVPLRTGRTHGAGRSLFTGLGLLVVFGSVPYATAWWLTGNPVFPFMNQVFQSPLWPVTTSGDTRWGTGVSWDLLYRATFQTPAFMESSPGGAGFQWLLIAVPAAVRLALARHGRGLTLIFIGVASVVLCFRETAYLRYIFPVYPLFAAGMAPALDTPAGESPRMAQALRAAAALAVALNILFLAAGPFVYRDFPLAAMLSERQRDDYLARRLPMRRMVEVVNALNYDRTPVAILADPLGAGLRSDALYTNWYNRPWLLAFATARNRHEMARLLERYDVQYLIVDDNFTGPQRPLRLLEAVTRKVAGLGSIQVRRFRSQASGRRDREEEGGP